MPNRQSQQNRSKSGSSSKRGPAGMTKTAQQRQANASGRISQDVQGSNYRGRLEDEDYMTPGRNNQSERRMRNQDDYEENRNMSDRRGGRYSEDRDASLYNDTAYRTGTRRHNDDDFDYDEDNKRFDTEPMGDYDERRGTEKRRFSLDEDDGRRESTHSSGRATRRDDSQHSYRDEDEEGTSSSRESSRSTRQGPSSRRSSRH